MAIGLNSAWLCLSEVCLDIVSVGKLGACRDRAKHCMAECLSEVCLCSVSVCKV